MKHGFSGPRMRASLGMASVAALLGACGSLPPSPVPGPTAASAPSGPSSTPSIASTQAGAAPGAVPAPIAAVTEAVALAEALPIGQATLAQVQDRLGPARSRIEFAQGHLALHYYLPWDGRGLRSLMPWLADLGPDERGRPATEVLLLFDQAGVLRQRLVRQLPDGPRTTRPNS